MNGIQDGLVSFSDSTKFLLHLLYSTDVWVSVCKHFNLKVEKDTALGCMNDHVLNDKNVKRYLTLVSDDMTTLDQTGQFVNNQWPDVIETFSAARLIVEQQAYQIAISSNS